MVIPEAQTFRMIIKVVLSDFSRLKIMIIVAIGLSLQSVFAQVPDPINLQEIPQRKVRSYMVASKIDQMQSYSLIHSSWKKDANESDFNQNQSVFYLKYKLSAVWDSYRSVIFARAWKGKSVRFGLLISKYPGTVTYADSQYFPEIDTGQVYFLNLKVLRGLFNVAVAFEIIRIDEKSQEMEFSYIDGNKTRGKQSIRFFDNGDGRTRIVHDTYFKSESSFRDNILYPHFHKKFIGEFHGNMKKYIENKGHPADNLAQLRLNAATKQVHGKSKAGGNLK